MPLHATKPKLRDGSFDNKTIYSTRSTTDGMYNEKNVRLINPNQTNGDAITPYQSLIAYNIMTYVYKCTRGIGPAERSINVKDKNIK
jgi:hypothetical protein